MSDVTGPLGAGSDEQPPAPRRWHRDVGVAVTGALAVLLVWFAVANLQGVRIQFWVTSATAPLIVVIAISGFLGAAVAGLLGRAARRRRRPVDGEPGGGGV
jgi:uncharacterized integral membrane protein